MSHWTLAILYAIGAIGFFAADHLSGRIAGSKPRPLISALFALVWPFAYPLAMLLMAAIFRRLRDSGAMPPAK